MSSTRETDSLPSFGRKNNDDSSSSRESSPVRKHKRSFSPTSDDEVVISVADDNTPPPEGPLIRQAVAFSWKPSIATAPASIDTYQAPSIPTQIHNTVFLPGQAVPAPPKPPKATRKKKKKPEDDPSSSRKTRFRIPAYDPTPSETPALTTGSGPYASMYRATGAKAEGEAPSEIVSAGRTKRTKLSNPQPKASTSKAKVSTSKAKSSISVERPSTIPSSDMHSVTPVPQDDASRPYYRRDYDQGNLGRSSPPGDDQEPTPEPHRLHANKRANTPLRLVTILIEDMRSEVPDSQLVEVRVALRASEDTTRDGFWASAEDICQTLQASPSRIDGPAKVYALRGRYRQLILRVTADNVDQFVSANVVVNPDRTLDVVIDTGLPGAPAGPSRVPRAVEEPESVISPQKATTSTANTKMDFESVNSSRKQQLPPADMHYGDASNPRRWSPSTMASSPRRSPPRGHRSHLNIPSIDLELPPSHVPERTGHRGGTESHTSESEDDDEDEDAIHERISEEVDELLQEDETDWLNYFKLSAKPRTAAAVVAEYHAVQGFIDKFVGKPVPSGPLIEPSHIARALRIQGDSALYLAECSETVHLLALYGAQGQRLQNPEVIEKARDDSLPAYNANPAKALLRLLRQIDRQWAAKDVQ